MHGVVSIITHKLEFSFSESCCDIEMAEVVEVGASAEPDKHTVCLTVSVRFLLHSIALWLSIYIAD